MSSSSLEDGDDGVEDSNGEEPDLGLCKKIEALVSTGSKQLSVMHGTSLHSVLLPCFAELQTDVNAQRETTHFKNLVLDRDMH